MLMYAPSIDSICVEKFKENSRLQTIAFRPNIVSPRTAVTTGFGLLSEAIEGTHYFSQAKQNKWM